MVLEAGRRPPVSEGYTMTATRSGRDLLEEAGIDPDDYSTNGNGHKPPEPSTEEKLQALQQVAADLLASKTTYASRLPILRAEAQGMGVTIRDPELLGILKAARRLRTHGDDHALLGPGDRLELTPEPWAWDGLILRRALNLLVALPKQGKTSLIVAMLAAWHRYDLAFLDRTLVGPCPPVLIVGTDQGQSDWGRMLQGVGWVDATGHIGGPIVGLAHAGRPLHLDPEGIDQIATYGQQHPGLLVVIDSLHACLAPLGLKEESPEIAEPIADLMEQLEPHGPTVILIHHANKGRAGEGASAASRGSTALPGLASQLLKLGPASSSPEDRRKVLTTEGRGGTSQTLVIRREAATWDLLGGAEVIQEEKAAEELLQKLSDGHFDALVTVCDRWEDQMLKTTAGDLVEELGITGRHATDVARKTLRSLEKRGLLQSLSQSRQGQGGKTCSWWSTDRGRTTARARTLQTGPFGSAGSPGALSREDPETDPSFSSLAPEPNDPNDQPTSKPARGSLPPVPAC